MNLKLTVIIPTYNEEKNIAKAISSVAAYVDQVVIADSFSVDNTLKIAANIANNVDFISIKYTTFANKMNEAIESCIIKNSWVMRLDADEVVINPEDFFQKLGSLIPTNDVGVKGYYINRRYYFNGKWIKNGSMYPRKVLRVFNKNNAHYEARSVDEKLLISGRTETIEIDIADKCNRGFFHWIKKHFQYAQREANDMQTIMIDAVQYDLEFDNITHRSKVRYYRAPLFIRPFLYFFYRLIIQKGYLDGIKGCFYHFIHAFIYRELVDFYILKRITTQIMKGEFK